MHYDNYNLHCVISIHALLAESDSSCRGWFQVVNYFYPRSPCGERPYDGLIASANFCNFYPRSPCGERLCCGCCARCRYWISIHALLAESDQPRKTEVPGAIISIHALLAESDCDFSQKRHPPHNFYPRSPCGERLLVIRWLIHRKLFLSTLSLRRATALASKENATKQRISIHALLAESDYDTSSLMQCQVKFLSTLSLRRATRRGAVPVILII